MVRFLIDGLQACDAYMAKKTNPGQNGGPFLGPSGGEGPAKPITALFGVSRFALVRTA